MISLQTNGDNFIPREVKVGFKYYQFDSLADLLF